MKQKSNKKQLESLQLQLKRLKANQKLSKPIALKIKELEKSKKK